jgi:hypothetical protein
VHTVRKVSGSRTCNSLHCTCGRAGVECATARRTDEEKSCSDEALHCTVHTTARVHDGTISTPSRAERELYHLTRRLSLCTPLLSSHSVPLASCTCTSPRRARSESRAVHRSSMELREGCAERRGGAAGVTAPAHRRGGAHCSSGSSARGCVTIGWRDSS